MTVRVQFVCAGNICRSPMAEAMFRHVVEQAGQSEAYAIESAGTGPWHVGEPPDSRMSQTARRHGVHLTGRARQFQRADFEAFDWIVAMDRENRDHLLRLARDEEDRRKVRLLREFDSEAQGELDVPDPWYGGPDGFEAVYAIVERASRRLLEELEKPR